MYPRLDACLDTIEQQNAEVWQQTLFDETKGVLKEYADKQDEIPSDEITNKKNQIIGAIAGNILLTCTSNLNNIAKEAIKNKERARNANIEDLPLIYFNYNNQINTFSFKIEDVFKSINLPTGFVIINNQNYSPGDVIELSSIPRKQKFFPDKCSDHNVKLNLDNKAAVNMAGQRVFSKYGGAQNEYFLDFADGDNRRAFPGLVIMDTTGSTQEQIVSYRNLITALEVTEKFASTLENGACSDNNLALYLVALYVQPDTENETATVETKNIPSTLQEMTGKQMGWKIAAGVGGGALAWIGTSAALYAASATVPAFLGSAMLATAAGAASVPVVGWIVAGALVVTAAGLSLYPWPIEHLDQVMVLDGPYPL